MNSIIPPLAWPWLTLLVLPLGWIEFKLLEKTRWGAVLGLLTAALLYGPWVMAVRNSTVIRMLKDMQSYSLSGVNLAPGLLLVFVGASFWILAAPRILRQMGEVLISPKKLVTDGPYRFCRHPLYLGHALVISGGVLAMRATDVLLLTPILWVIAGLAGRYEEQTRLQPLFGEALLQYQKSTPMLLPTWGWIALAIYFFLTALWLMQVPLYRLA